MMRLLIAAALLALAASGAHAQTRQLVTPCGNYTAQAGANTPTMGPNGADCAVLADGPVLTGSAIATGAITLSSGSSVIDMSGYAGISVQITANGSATTNLQWSNDQTTWVSDSTGYNPAIVTATPFGSMTSAGLTAFKKVARYARLNVTAYTSGTTSVAVAPVTAEFAFPATYVGVLGKVSNGTSTSRVNTAATTNATVTKASAGVVFGWHLCNATASLKYARLFNKATAPTVGTDTPVITIAVPPSACAGWTNDIGVTYGTGIGYDVTGANGDADTTATAAGDVTGSIMYQ